MDRWLHCNLCLARPTAKQKIFLVTNCRHIFCGKCEKTATSPKCVICNKSCSYQWIGDKMNPIFKEFFKPCDDMEKKALATLQRAREIRKFQQKHMSMLREGERKKAVKSQIVLKTCMESIEKLKKKNSQLKELFEKTTNQAYVSPSAKAVKRGHSGQVQEGFKIPNNSNRYSPYTGTPTYNQGLKLPSNSRNASPSIANYSKMIPYASSSIPNTPRTIIKPKEFSSAIQSQFQKSKRVSLISPPFDGRIVSPKDRNYVIKHRNNVQGIAGTATSSNDLAIWDKSPIPNAMGTLNQKFNLTCSPLLPGNLQSNQQTSDDKWNVNRFSKTSTPSNKSNLNNLKKNNEQSPFTFSIFK